MKKLSLFAAVIIVAGALIGWTQNSQNVWIRGVLKAGTGQVAITDTTGNLTFSSASGSNKITLTDNLASALDVTESTNSYLKFVTTNSSEGITAAKALTCSSTLAVTGASTFGSTVDVTGAVAVTGAATLRSTLAVTGASTFGSTVDVTGAVSATGAATLRSTLAVTGAATLSSTLGVNGAVGVTGAATLRSTLDVVGNTGVSGSLGVTGAVELRNASLTLSSLAAGVTAATGSAQGDGAMTTLATQVSTAASAGDAVTLPAAAAGRVAIVCSRTAANAIDVFPASSDAINKETANTAISLASGECMWCLAFDDVQWGCVIGSAN